MAKQAITDELWAAVEPLLPPEPVKAKVGRPRGLTVSLPYFPSNASAG